MALELKWTDEAEDTFDEIIDHLEREWTVNDVQNFVRKAYQVLNQISEYPNSFKQSKSKKIRMAVITKHNSLFYKVHSNKVELLSFWNNHEDPKKKKYHPKG